MHDPFVAFVPRNLRVRRTLVWWNVRIPVRVFLLLAGALAIAFIAVIVTGSVIATIQTVAVATGIVTVVLEVKWSSRSVMQTVPIVLRHLTRQKRLRLLPQMMSIQAEVVEQPQRQVRWVAPE